MLTALPNLLIRPGPVSNSRTRTVLTLPTLPKTHQHNLQPSPNLTRLHLWCIIFLIVYLCLVGRALSAARAAYMQLPNGEGTGPQSPTADVIEGRWSHEGGLVLKAMSVGVGKCAASLMNCQWSVRHSDGALSGLSRHGAFLFVPHIINPSPVQMPALRHCDGATGEGWLGTVKGGDDAKRSI